MTSARTFISIGIAAVLLLAVATPGDAAWIQDAKLNATDKQAVDFFGISVSLSGTTALVGASGEAPDGLLHAGSAYVFSGPPPDAPPVADADGPYSFSASNQDVILDGSGSTDDVGIANYNWVGGAATLYDGPNATQTVTIADPGALGFTSQSDVVSLTLTVTDAASQTDAATALLSYIGFDAVINSCSVQVIGDYAHFDFTVEDQDLVFNGSVAGWQVLSLEIDDEAALGEGDVAAAGAYWFDVYNGTDPLVNPSDVAGSATIALHLSLFAPGTNTVWLNIAGSLDSAPLTFWNHYPEPTTLTLLAFGGLGLWRRRRRVTRDA